MKKIMIMMTAMVMLNVYFSMKTFAGSDESIPTLSSDAAIMIDADNGSVLYEKNADEKMYPASLTKIATAIYAIETGNLDDIVTVSKKARNVDGTRVYLEEGEQVTLKKLLQGLLINSGNDAGVAIAEHLSGSVKQFSSDINRYLKNIVGVHNTNFENPHGLFDPNHVTTAEDIAKITQYAMQNEVFRKLFGTEELEWDGESWDTTLYTHHKLMREIPYDGITGGKTGYVDRSGFTLATTAEREDLSLIVITLNSNLQSEAYADTINLLDYGFEHFQRSSISKGEIFEVNNREYKAPRKLTYTHTLEGEVSKEMDSNGTLSIINQEGTLINSFQLKQVKTENEKSGMDTVVENTNSNPGFEMDSLNVVVISVIIVLGVFSLYYRRHKNVT
ncbi:D-alanyl-D-alanine carboxypeptidase family protein [Virgibacillus oceani]|uniref:Peptidase S11 D-alanyl-D-alanine carboxypeptidase A N-terminal domain-containing protein n=1 Tax=Virgibacillus oceani TaxID=1479511 RepID=A0A917LX54_9BACI|nr:D-alanyl-D-alanine carboxypeptidase family protein [Virgibacillus oceani]GGG61206.1 hypothetical protein GCM10011398_00600 [Virgibacillus oceani]